MLLFSTRMYGCRQGFSSCASFASYTSDGLFYTVGNFYTWTLSYKGNMKNKLQKNFLKKLFVVTGWRLVKCCYLNAKVLLILKHLLQISTIFTQIGIKCSIFEIKSMLAFFFMNFTLCLFCDLPFSLILSSHTPYCYTDHAMTSFGFFPFIPFN